MTMMTALPLFCRKCGLQINVDPSYSYTGILGGEDEGAYHNHCAPKPAADALEDRAREIEALRKLSTGSPPLTIGTIAKLEVKPGDAVVLRTDRALQAEQYAYIRDVIASQLAAGVGVIVIPPGWDLSVLAPTDAAIIERSTP